MSTRSINFQELANVFNRKSKTIKTDARLWMNAYAIKMLNEIVYTSPFDTGVYKGNHRVTIGYPTVYFDNTKDKDGSNTINKGVGFIQSVQQGDDSIFIQSALPYALRLENGYSKKAPNGVYSQAFKAVKIDDIKLSK